MQVIDLSHPVTPDMPLYPGTPQPCFSSLSTIREQGFTERSLTMSSHTGTHVDVPSHLLESGRSLDGFQLGHFFGRGAVIDVSAAEDTFLHLADLCPYETRLAGVDYALLRSGWDRYWGTDRYFQDYPVLDPDVSVWLAAFNLKGIGADMPSFDTPASSDYPVHREFLDHDIVLVENLANLQLLPETGFFFCCFPLKIAGGEAAPVRAAALI